MLSLAAAYDIGPPPFSGGCLQAGGGTSSGPAAGSGYEIILQGFNWDSYKNKWYKVSTCSIPHAGAPLLMPAEQLPSKCTSSRSMPDVQICTH